ncbi:histone H3.1 [Exophiala xenobiotica]|nr:histone H3.1 [Exophiala xenobiotica]
MAPTEQTDGGNDIGDDQPKKSPAESAATRPGKKVSFKKKSGRSKDKPETVAQRELRRVHGSMGLVIPERPFSTLVVELLQEHPVSNLRIQNSAVGAMQECLEVYLVSLFEGSIHSGPFTLGMAYTKFYSEANLYAGAANRVTVLPRDLQRTLRMRAEAAAVTTDKPERDFFRARSFGKQ